MISVNDHISLVTQQYENFFNPSLNYCVNEIIQERDAIDGRHGFGHRIRERAQSFTAPTSKNYSLGYSF